MTRRQRTSRWALQDAKNRFSEVVEAAAQGEAQIVTRRGIETAVVLGHEEYQRLVAARDRGPTLGQYLVGGTARFDKEPFERINLAARDDV